MPVTERKLNQLRKLMAELEILEDNLVERFIKCSGPGGQKLQKTNSGVDLYYPVEDIRVKSTSERSKELNRYYARKRLCEKVATRKGIPTKESTNAARLKKQKDRRRRRSKSGD